MGSHPGKGKRTFLGFLFCFTVIYCYLEIYHLGKHKPEKRGLGHWSRDMGGTMGSVQWGIGYDVIRILYQVSSSELGE